MKLIKVAAGSLNQTPFAWEANISNIKRAIDYAKNEGVKLLCLPELCITGYGCEDQFLSQGLIQRAIQALIEITPETDGIAVTVGLPVFYHNAVFNVAAYLVDGKIIGLVAKKHLAGDGIHYEPRWFKPWPEGQISNIQIGNQTIPMGDLVFDCKGIRIGFEICEDAWAAFRPGVNLASKAVDIILNPSASHFSFGKHQVRKRFVLEGSRAFGTAYVYANLLGCESGRTIYDGGNLVVSGGEVIVEGNRFSYKPVIVDTAVIDIDVNRGGQARKASFEPNLNEPCGSVVEVDFKLDQDGLSNTLLDSSMAVLAYDKYNEFQSAVCLGLYDYLRKTSTNGYVVSLSGGADSSAASILVAEMINAAVIELGLNGFKEVMRHINGVEACLDADSLVALILTCVYQSTRNSSQTTMDSARNLANDISANYFKIDIDHLVESYTSIIGNALNKELNWSEHDIALQNIQARVRGPSVWLIANIKNALLLATSNRSEAAVGYATMDGDTCGSLSPLAGIDKAFLREWLCYKAKYGMQGNKPLPALEDVVALEPSAELRPEESKQTDEDDLMPYDVLDFIEKAAIRDKKIPTEVMQTVYNRYKEVYVENKITQWVIKFFTLWSKNQWKRERYAPSFHLDDENLDPKTWCRFPIISGGFEEELEVLRTKIIQN